MKNGILLLMIAFICVSMVRCGASAKERLEEKLAQKSLDRMEEQEAKASRIRTADKVKLAFKLDDDLRNLDILVTSFYALKV